TLAPCRSVGRLDPNCVRTLPDLLAHAEGTTFDTILAWDLFDHLGAEGVAALVERLAPFCHEGTLLHALVTRGAQMPAHPQRFEVVDQRTILCRPPENHDTRPA